MTPPTSARPAALRRVAWIAERSGWPLLRDGRLPVNPSQPDGLVRGAYCVSRIMMSHNRQALKVREIGPGRSASAVSLDRGTVREVGILGCRYPRVCASRLTHSSRCCQRRLFAGALTRAATKHGSPGTASRYVVCVPCGRIRRVLEGVHASEARDRYLPDWFVRVRTGQIRLPRFPTTRFLDTRRGRRSPRNSRPFRPVPRAAIMPPTRTTTLSIDAP